MLFLRQEAVLSGWQDSIYPQLMNISCSKVQKGSLDSRPDHIINQIHYEDAASLAIAIMKKRHRSHIFLGCDNKPLSRQEIMDSVNRSGKFDTKFQGFTGTDGPLGKRMENSKTRSEIGWEPKYPSFSEFLGLDS
uniref:NAD-dependent epimerase/dehydratase domain-containing protein n=1 Tax=Leersia perrieri TaxID=77586 RepID=A0A0D9V101_9ORYZ